MWLNTKRQKTTISTERELVISILKLTREGPVREELLYKDAGIPSQIVKDLLEKLSLQKLIRWKDNLVKASTEQRVKLAVHAVKLNADIQRACKFLLWNEFESIAIETFKMNHFAVKKHFRFKHLDKRWEIDIIGCKKPMIVCVDCKHWHHGWQTSAIKRTVEAQVQRTQALARSYLLLASELKTENWKQIVMVPVVLSLIPASFKFYNKVPLVPILQLRDFLNKLQAHLDSLKHFSLTVA